MHVYTHTHIRARAHTHKVIPYAGELVYEKPMGSCLSLWRQRRVWFLKWAGLQSMSG